MVREPGSGEVDGAGHGELTETPHLHDTTGMPPGTGDLDARPGPPAAVLARPRSARRTAALLFLAAVALYTSTGRAFLNADAVPARYLPISILREGDFDLDEFTFLYDDAARVAYPSPEGHPYFMTRVRGHYVSRYSPGAGVLAVPVYALPVLAGLPASSPHLWLLERLAAASLIALSAVFLFLALCELTSQARALLIAALYAFGTGSFSVTSQILWEQTATQFLLAAAILAVIRSERAPAYLWWAGAALAAVTMVRPPDLLLTAPIGLYLLVRHRVRFLRVVAGGIVPVLAAVAHNYANLGTLGGSDRAAAHFAAYVWAIPYFEGLYGLLLSPSRGLFVFSPFLLVALPGIAVAWMRGPTVLRYLSVGPVLLVSLYAKYIFWDGGWGYGPRYLLDIVAILCLFVPAPLEWIARRPVWRAGFLTLGLAAVGVHALGAYFYDPAWEGQAPTMQENYKRIRRWRSSQILWHVRQAYRAANSVRAQWTASHTSANAPDRLGARYEADVRPRTVQAGAVLDIPVQATNSGQAVWLDKPEGYYGAVRLGWSWWREGEEVEPKLGREDLPSPISPGASHRFLGRLTAPDAPGDYTLRIGLVSELVAYFHDRGVPQLEVAVHVTPR